MADRRLVTKYCYVIYRTTIINTWALSYFMENSCNCHLGDAIMCLAILSLEMCEALLSCTRCREMHRFCYKHFDLNFVMCYLLHNDIFIFIIFWYRKAFQDHVPLTTGDNQIKKVILLIFIILVFQEEIFIFKRHF